MTPRVKICGLVEPETLNAAVAAGAAYIGFNFVQRSPRYVAPNTARDLALSVPEGTAKVGLTMNAGDEELDAIVDAVPLDILQLHGDESPERVLAVKERFGLPVIKAIGLATEADLSGLDAHARVADQILVDAKPSRDTSLPGGNGVAFDWRLVAGRRWPVPWMLAGGLTPDNVHRAIELTNATQVDVSSGVESAPGQKDANLIREFIAAASRP